MATTPLPLAACLKYYLNDRGFAGLAPSRYNLEELAREELRLRKEIAKLRYTPLVSDGFRFNENASDLVRMHFLGFDVIREMGLVPILLRYDTEAKRLLSRTLRR